MLRRKFLFSASFAAVLAATMGSSATAGPSSTALDPSGPAAGGRQRPPNVLLIMADDLNTRLGAYGDRQVRTPNIDRLAREGVLFSHAYTQFPECAQSRASFLTGRRPNATKVFNLTTGFRAALPTAVTLPQRFRQEGYFTGRVGKIFHQGVPRDVGTGGPDDAASWDEVVNPAGRDKAAEKEGRLINLSPGVPIGTAMALLADDGDDSQQTDGMVAAQAIQMMERNKDRPFFIGVGFYRPHVPDVAPKPYFDLYPLDQIELVDESARALADLPEVTTRTLPANLDATPEEQRRVIQAYYASITYMDAQLGHVLDALKRLGLEDDTIVIFLSDHGYMLGEHGQWFKTLLWEPSLRTPLIIRAPRVGARGKIVDAPVELLDLYPTVAELVGLSPPTDLEGVSLASVVAAPRTADPEKPAFSQVQGGRSVRVGRWRYTEWEGGRLGASLHDLQRDPAERRNLVDDPQQKRRVAQFRALLGPGPVERRQTLYYYDRARQTWGPIPYGSPGSRAGDTRPPV